MKAEFKVEITLVSSGKVALFNQYLPGKKHEPRREQEISQVYKTIVGEEFPTGRTWLAVDVGGETLESKSDFSMPTVQYYFK